ncbi:MAG: hypothetical protein K1000chlam3_00013 [Chlamydiae bacterium]|nr:hypothetical protein [Chlamydiota bacterium]
MNKHVIKLFVKEWAEARESKSILHIDQSITSLFHLTESSERISKIEEIPSHKTFDLILLDIPTEIGFIEYVDRGRTIKARKHWLTLLEVLPYLSSNGDCLFMSNSLDFHYMSGFENLLNNNDFYTNALFDTELNLILLDSGEFPDPIINPVLAHISRKETNEIYIDILKTGKSTRDAIYSYLLPNNNKNNINLIERNSFYGFEQLNASQKIEWIETHYKTYKQYRLEELAISINSLPINAWHHFDDQENAIYLPIFPANAVISLPPEATHCSYIQLVLNSEIVTNKYISTFFNSTLGKLVLQSVTPPCGLQMERVQNLILPVPSLEIQNFIVQIAKKLTSLNNQIKFFDSEFCINPSYGESILTQLNEMLEVVGKLTHSDRVKQIIHQGETKTSEFKETLSLDVRKQIKADYIELSALKTIVAFLNTDGGHLIIGVSDEKTIIGIDSEMQKFNKNTDNYLLHWKNLIKSQIGEQFYPFIDSNILLIDGKNLLHIECKPSQNPCFLKESDFYVRTNPATDKLEGQKQLEYIKNRFHLVRS